MQKKIFNDIEKFIYFSNRENDHGINDNQKLYAMSQKWKLRDKLSQTKTKGFDYIINGEKVNIKREDTRLSIRCLNPDLFFFISKKISRMSKQRKQHLISDKMVKYSSLEVDVNDLDLALILMSSEKSFDLFSKSKKEIYKK